MFNNNRHLSIFEHYGQAGALPIENNVSRGIAILFGENTLFLDRYIDYLNEKCRQKGAPPLSKPQRKEDVDIGIQQTIKGIIGNCESAKTVVGITLTTAFPTGWEEEKRGTKDSLIADMCMLPLHMRRRYIFLMMLSVRSREKASPSVVGTSWPRL